MARTNPHIQTQGLVPYLGARLDINRTATVALFVFIVALHFVVALSAVWAVRDVDVEEY